MPSHCRLAMATLAALLAVAAAGPLTLESASAQQLHTLVACFRQQDDDFWPCMKEGALGLMDRALTLDTVPLVEGVVTLERDPRHVLDASDELDLPHEREAREQRLDDLLWRRTFAFLESSSLRIQLPSQRDFEGRFKMKKMKKLALPLAIVLTMVLLAVLAMKAVVMSKVALAVISWVFIKKFLNGGAKKETFEIVAKHPEHHHEHSYHESSAGTNHVASIANREGPPPGFGPFGRLFEAQALAYNAHQNPQQAPSSPSTPEPPKDKLE